MTECYPEVRIFIRTIWYHLITPKMGGCMDSWIQRIGNLPLDSWIQRIGNLPLQIVFSVQHIKTKTM